MSSYNMHKINDQKYTFKSVLSPFVEGLYNATQKVVDDYAERGMTFEKEFFEGYLRKIDSEFGSIKQISQEK